MRYLALLIPLIAGCGSESDVPAHDTEAEGTDEVEGTPPELTGEPCEDSSCLQDGVALFEGGSSSRLVHAWFPENPAGAPVIFVWHHLGGSPEELLEWMPVQQGVDDGFVVIAAESRQLPFSEWDVTNTGANNVDLSLFDDMLDSLIDVQKVDADRIYATGFSAGGLFTTMLTMHRGTDLAATAPFSGGAPSYSYTTPSGDLPVMVSWGGPSDTYGTFNFADASSNFAESLAADGHEVLTCVHSLGHWLPADATSRTLSFFSEHAQTGDVASFASCDRL